MTDLDTAALNDLLRKAHAVVTWTGQDTLNRKAAGYKHLAAARHEYLRARVDAYATVRPLTIGDCGGCTCQPYGPDCDSCLYHYAARLQPDNHRIPWNCPTFYDGCNCEPATDLQEHGSPENS
jgi:hypothetical protein